MKKKILIGSAIVGTIVVAGVVVLLAFGNKDEGCAAVSQSELLKMINQGDMIEVEVMAPINEELGEEQSISWKELAAIIENGTLRSEWDDFLGIIKTDTGKNGMLYVNVDGANDNNNTLAVALHNREFIKIFESKDSVDALADAVSEQYADIELDIEDNSQALYMGINGYFNLLPDATPNYCNPDSTLTRAEFMAMVMRAVTPVSEIEIDSEFEVAVGSNELNLYAQEVAEHSYLDLTSKSLNNMTYNGTITRAEALHLLVNLLYSDSEVGIASFSDARNGGNIAEQQKFIEKGVAKDYWKSYELTYAIQNPDKGLPTALYESLVKAYDNGILTSSETRWDEGITKVEAVEFIVNALRNYEGIKTYSATLGTVSGYDTTIQDETTPIIQGESNGAGENASYGTEDTTYCDFTPIDEITLYSKVDGSMYDNPNLHEGALVNGGGFSVNESITFNYKTTYNDVEYYVIKTEDGLVLLARADQFSETPVEVKSETQTPATEQTQPSTNTSTQKPVTNDKYPAGSVASQASDEQIQAAIDLMRSEGFTEAEIAQYLFSTGNEGSNAVNRGDVSGDMTDVSDIPEDILQKLQGMQTH